MKVKLEMSRDEILAAIRQWLTERNVPALAIDSLKLLRFKEYGSADWESVDRLKVEVEFESEAYSVEGTPRA